MKQVTTKNSVYRIDPENNRIMRVTGINPVTNHFFPEGAWKTYESVGVLEVGRPLFIFWNDAQVTRLTDVVNVLELS